MRRRPFRDRRAGSERGEPWFVAAPLHPGAPIVTRYKRASTPSQSSGGELTPHLASATAEVNSFTGELGRLLNVQDGVDARVEERTEHRHVTRDQRDVICLNDREAASTVNPSDELQEVSALRR
jgi:hypothetical protein